MPLWQVDIEKVYAGEYWTNRYIVVAADLDEANTTGASIVEVEQTIHCNLVTFTKYRTSDVIEGTDVYQINALNQPGLVSPASEFLPLFNVVRVDFTTFGGGRPSRKYLRLPLQKDQVVGMLLKNTFLTFVQTNYAALLPLITAYVDVDGQGFSSGSVSPMIGMRQLRRGSKRKVEPILP